MKPNELKDFLKIVLQKDPTKVILLQGPVGIGKCLHLNSKNDFVVSGDGKMIHIKDLPKEVVTLNNNFKFENSKVKKEYNRYVNKLLKITTRTGKRIELTFEHPLFTINGWKKAEELTEGDYLATPRKYDLKLKKELPPEYVKIIAYILAEGHLQMRSITFTNSDKEIVNELKESIEKHYPSLTLKKLGDYDKYGYVISRKIIKNDKINKRNPLVEEVNRLGLTNKNAGTKFIPNEIMELCNKQIAIFLNRLYSCDGWAYKNQIGICLKSEIMIRQIQHLLLRFGVISTIYKKLKYATNTREKIKRVYWELLITSNEGRSIFKRNVGFFLKKKQKKIHVNKKTNTNIDVIPIKPIKKQGYRDEKGRWKKGMDVKLILPKLPASMDWIYPSRNTLNKFAEYYKDGRYLKLANSDIFWDKIKKVEKIEGKFQVWDIEIDNINHNFIANDIIVHNSEITEQVANELGWELREVILSLMDPTDLKGIPFADMQAKIARWLRAEYLPPEDYDNPLLIFFDELNNASATMQNACMNMLLRRNLNGYRLPKQTRIIAAGNRLEDDCYTFRLSPALRTRLINIDVELCFDSWKVWAYQHNINPLIIGFHNYRKGDLLYNYKSGMDIDKPFACPRTWKFVNDFMEMQGLSNGMFFDAIKGAVGEAVAIEFYGYTKIYKDLPKPEDILLKGKDIIPKESNVMYALVSALINCVKSHKDKLNRLIEYAIKIQPEFSAVLVKDLLKTEMRDETIATKSFDIWVKQNKDIVME